MSKQPVSEERKSPGRSKISIVATNDDYARLCATTLARVTVSRKAEVISSARMNDRLPSVARSDLVLFISRLSDFAQDSPGGKSQTSAWKLVRDCWNQPAGKARSGTAFSRPSVKQIFFLEELPVEAVASRLLPLNIRDPQRLHIAAARDASSRASLIYRLVSGLTQAQQRAIIVDAWIENENLVLLSPSFDRLEVPLEKLARWIGRDPARSASFEIDEDGSFLHWPHADVHFGWAQFRQLIDPTSALAEAQQTKQFNVRYGAAIHALRVESGLKQTDIHGVTERQLRRVEHGEQAASKATLTALAKAHSLSLCDYLDGLAKCMANKPKKAS